jgi:hypothetical protein
LFLQITELAEEREVALEHRDRLRRMQPDREEFLNKLLEDRKSIFKVTIVASIVVFSLNYVLENLCVGGKRSGNMHFQLVY